MPVTGYTYEADNHCVDCAKERFQGSASESPENVDANGIPYDIEDAEGNTIGAMFPDSETDYTVFCGDCGEYIVTQVIGGKN